MGGTCSRGERVHVAKTVHAAKTAAVSPSASFFGGETRSAAALTDDVLRKYDTNGNGVLDAKELSALLADAFPGSKLTDDDVAVFMKELDANGDGQIGTNELRAFLRCYDPTAQRIKPRSALVIIDVQNDFISGTLANPAAEAIVPVINAMRGKFDLVVISYDWHPEEHCSFADSVNAGKVAIKEQRSDFQHFETVTLLGDDDRAEHSQVLYPRHAVQRTLGAECHKDLVLMPTDKRVWKGIKPNIDSYSAFFDNCKANDTGLTAILEAERITDVYCCGLVFDICVKSTALHGAELGFRMTVVEDACRPLDPKQVEPTKAQLAQAGVVVATAEEVGKTLAERKDCALQEYLEIIRRSRGAKAVHAEAQPSSHARAPAK